MFAAGAEEADTAVMLREAVVTASPAAKEVTSTSPVFVYDAERLNREGAESVADAVHRLPGVTLRDYGGAGGLKTVQVRGFGAGHTAVCYDGVALGNAQTGQIDISRYSISNVANLELVVGDNDDIFVPATLAASASKLAIASDESVGRQLSARAQVRLGSWGLVSPFVRVSVPVGERAKLWCVGEFTHAKNDYPFRLYNGDATVTERRTNSRMNDCHAELNGMWRSGSSGSVSAKAYYYGSSHRLPGPAIHYNPVSNEALKQHNAAGQAIWRQAFGDKWMVMGQGRFDFSTQRYSDRDGIYPGGYLMRHYVQRQAYASGTAMFIPSVPWAIAYSADYTYASFNSNRPSAQKPHRHSVLQSLTGRYRQGPVSAMARLLLSVHRNGDRASKPLSVRDATRLSPSASVSVQPWQNRLLFLRASYKHIFRMPSFSEAYFDHYGSADLLPETTQQFNVGTTYTCAPRGILSALTLSADAYANFVRDMIVAVPYNMFVWRILNMGKVRVLGLDVTANAALDVARGHQLGISGNLSYQQAQPRTSRQSTEWMKQVAYIPRITGSFAVSWENPWVSMSVSGTGVGERFTSSANTPATRLAPYFELGAAAWRSLQLGRHTLTARITLQNLLNKQYQVVARYPMPGRSVQVAVSYTFAGR